MSLSRTGTAPARSPQAPAARRPRRPLEMDASELAHLINLRLGAGAEPARPCALLLVRLGGRDGPRAVLPTVSVKSMLPAIRNRLHEVLKDADRFSVLGPDEVIVFLAQVPSESVARLAMNRLLHALTLRYQGDGSGTLLHPAVGGAMPTDRVRSAEQLAAAADDACRIAAEREDRLYLMVGGNAAQDRSDLLPELRAAIDGNRLEVHYQPQFSFAKRRCTTVEALVRWPRPPAAEPVGADTIVALASRHGLIQSLTRFVLDTALREMRDLSRSGVQIGVAVNLAPTLFVDQELADTVAQALSVWNFPPELLTLEITEVADLRDAETALATMKRLRGLGARLSIDDFGTGWSSLARLRAMPLAELKIDRLFVASMNHARGDLQIVRSVIDLGHNFELEVVAEGVEDLATARHLHSLGCDTIQGYYLSRPLRADRLRQWWGRQPDLLGQLDADPA